MTVFDYVVLGVLGISVLLGFWRGVISEVLALVAWVAAFVAARTWGAEAGTWFEGVVAEPALRYAAGFATLLVLVLIVFAVARWVLTLLVKAVGLRLVDRILGAAFGVLRGGLIVLIGVLLAGMTTLPKAQAWRDGVLAPPLETLAVAVKPWLPVEVAKRIHYR